MGMASPVPAAPRSRRASFLLARSRADAMPLFTADGERSWAAGWDPDVVSGDTAPGSVFRTRGHDGAESVWIVVDYSVERGLARYARVSASNAALIDVDCTARGAAQCEVGVRYTLTALNDDGAAFVERFLEPGHYDGFIAEWARAIARADPQQPRIA
jgi:hypothetical protein